MLLSNSLRSLGRCSLAHSQLYQQLRQPNRLVTPISCYHHFHRKEDETSKITGLMYATSSVSSGINLHKAIHSNSAMYLRYSNLLEQKVGDGEKKIANDGSKSEDANKIDMKPLEEGKQLGLFQRFKKMAKEYWYVLIPVHVVTSAVWLGAFYWTSKSGVDIVKWLEYYEFSETIVRPLKNSHLGHIAVAYFLYKVATPARYTVTLGGTTFAIKFLSKRGIIKPMPTKDQMMQIYKDKKDDLQQKVADKKQELQDKKQELQDKFMKK